ncbi:hypothetical protein LQ948_15510 [Jiella sp. MQZ9-1]|uniref:Protamine-2 (Modular protein) n=1 Tax=Jiella flava TaxID=2816857 RepID=A0A939JY48_9HYPH|nr:hypothetical protein [Jiella flava]MBO0664041.1 hypothetical protein [Jiella flava]MCD2472613.1 hypothetical protein [Jiella flava]
MNIFKWPRRSGGAEPMAEPDPARRRLLIGFGVATCAVAFGAPSFIRPAEAALGEMPADDLLAAIDNDGEDGEDGSYELAHYTGYRHRHGRRIRRRRRRLRRLRRECRNPYFRRNNPRLCGVPRRRRNRRGCVRIGNVTVCD